MMDAAAGEREGQEAAAAAVCACVCMCVCSMCGCVLLRSARGHVWRGDRYLHASCSRAHRSLICSQVHNTSHKKLSAALYPRCRVICTGTLLRATLPRRLTRLLLSTALARCCAKSLMCWTPGSVAVCGPLAHWGGQTLRQPTTRPSTPHRFVCVCVWCVGVLTHPDWMMWLFVLGHVRACFLFCTC